MASHHDAFKKRLVTALADNGALTALLSSASAIYYRRPPAAVAYPALLFHYDTEYPHQHAPPGARALKLVIEAAGPDAETLDRIEEALRALLDGGHDALSTASWRCARLRLLRSDQSSLDHRDPATSAPLLVTATHWDVLLLAR